MLSRDDRTEFFYDLTPDRVLDAVQVDGMGCTGRFIVLNSYENRVYQLELSDGRYVVAKFYRPGRWSDAAILDEHDFQIDLEEAEVPVAAPLEFEDGETISTVEGIRFSVAARIGGRAPDDMNDDQLRRLGRVVARMHAVGRTDEAEHRLSLDPETYIRADRDLLDRGGHLPPAMRDRYMQATDRLLALSEPRWVDLELQRIHGDVHLGNLISSPGGLVLLDFDDMVMGPPVQDLWMMIGGRDAWAQRRQNLILEGYESMASFDRSSLHLIELLRGMRYVHYTAWLALRWSDPAFQVGFPDFGGPDYWARTTRDLEEQVELAGRARR